MLSTWRMIELLWGIPSFSKRPHSHAISGKVADMAQYITLVDDLETWSYFLYIQEIKAAPKHMHQPIVDQCVSEHQA